MISKYLADFRLDYTSAIACRKGERVNRCKAATVRAGELPFNAIANRSTGERIELHNDDIVVISYNRAVAVLRGFIGYGLALWNCSPTTVQHRCKAFKNAHGSFWDTDSGKWYLMDTTEPETVYK